MIQIFFQFKHNIDSKDLKYLKVEYTFTIECMYSKHKLNKLLYI